MKFVFILFALTFLACSQGNDFAQQGPAKKRAFTFDCPDEDKCLFEAGQKCNSDYDTKWINHNNNTYAISVECK